MTNITIYDSTYEVLQYISEMKQVNIAEILDELLDESDTYNDAENEMELNELE